MDWSITNKYFHEYERKRVKNIFDSGPFLNDASQSQEMFTQSLKKWSDWAVSTNLIPSRKELKKKDLIDCVTLAKEQPVKPSDLPGLIFSDEEKSLLYNEWWLVVPPFESGVLRINRNRYFRFSVLSIDPVNKGYEVELLDLAMEEGAWLPENAIEAKLSLPTSGNSLFQSEVGGVRLSEIIADTVPDIKGWSQNELLFFKEFTIPLLNDDPKESKQSDIESSFGHFAMAILRTNLTLRSEKPKTKKEDTENPVSEKNGAKVKTITGEVDTSPKPRVIRTYRSGITITSEKPPKSTAKEIIRKYTVESWKTRGHVRHYKTGKTAYIRPSVHHRKCLKGQGSGEPAQTIIVVKNEQ